MAAVLQLISDGMQDLIPISAPPEPTPFKTVFRRHTAFFQEAIPMPVQLRFGAAHSWTLPKCGELLTGVALRVALPQLKAFYGDDWIQALAELMGDSRYQLDEYDLRRLLGEWYRDSVYQATFEGTSYRTLRDGSYPYGLMGGLVAPSRYGAPLPTGERRLLTLRTAGTPYGPLVGDAEPVYDASWFDGLTDRVGYYKQTQDITIDSVDSFAYLTNGAVFDGQGYTIHVVAGLVDFEGLFFINNATVMNVHVDVARDGQGRSASTLRIWGGWIIGWDAGYNSGNVLNCSTNGDANAEGSGCLIGADFSWYDKSVVRGCQSTGSVRARYGGGILGYGVGYEGTVEISDCVMHGSVEDQDLLGNYVSSAGGICGFYPGGGDTTITRCAMLGAMIGSTNPNATGNGGIIGENGVSMTITYCYSTGIVGNESGGITGTRFGAESFAPNIKVINRCFSTGHIAGKGAGGIMAVNSAAQLYECFALGSIGTPAQTNWNAAGLAAMPLSIDARDCYVAGDILAEQCGGLLSGFVSDGNLSNCYFSGDLYTGSYGLTTVVGDDVRSVGDGVGVQLEETYPDPSLNLTNEIVVYKSVLEYWGLRKLLVPGAEFRITMGYFIYTDPDPPVIDPLILDDGIWREITSVVDDDNPQKSHITFTPALPYVLGWYRKVVFLVKVNSSALTYNDVYVTAGRLFYDNRTPAVIDDANTDVSNLVGAIPPDWDDNVWKKNDGSYPSLRAFQDPDLWQNYTTHDSQPTLVYTPPADIVDRHPNLLLDSRSILDQNGMLAALLQETRDQVLQSDVDLIDMDALLRAPSGLTYDAIEYPRHTLYYDFTIVNLPRSLQTSIAFGLDSSNSIIAALPLRETQRDGTTSNMVAQLFTPTVTQPLDPTYAWPYELFVVRPKLTQTNPVQSYSPAIKVKLTSKTETLNLTILDQTATNDVRKGEVVFLYNRPAPSDADFFPAFPSFLTKTSNGNLVLREPLAVALVEFINSDKEALAELRVLPSSLDKATSVVIDDTVLRLDGTGPTNQPRLVKFSSRAAPTDTLRLVQTVPSLAPNATSRTITQLIQQNLPGMLQTNNRYLYDTNKFYAPTQFASCTFDFDLTTRLATVNLDAKTNQAGLQSLRLSLGVNSPYNVYTASIQRAITQLDNSMSTALQQILQAQTLQLTRSLEICHYVSQNFTDYHLRFVASRLPSGSGPIQAYDASTNVVSGSGFLSSTYQTRSLMALTASLFTENVTSDELNTFLNDTRTRLELNMPPWTLFPGILDVVALHDDAYWFVIDASTLTAPSLPFDVRLVIPNVAEGPVFTVSDVQEISYVEFSLDAVAISNYCNFTGTFPTPTPKPSNPLLKLASVKYIGFNTVDKVIVHDIQFAHAENYYDVTAKTDLAITNTDIYPVTKITTNYILYACGLEAFNLLLRSGNVGRMRVRLSPELIAGLVAHSVVPFYLCHDDISTTAASLPDGNFTLGERYIHAFSYTSIDGFGHNLSKLFTSSLASVSAAMREMLATSSAFPALRLDYCDAVDMAYWTYELWRKTPNGAPSLTLYGSAFDTQPRTQAPYADELYERHVSHWEMYENIVLHNTFGLVLRANGPTDADVQSASPVLALSLLLRYIATICKLKLLLVNKTARLSTGKLIYLDEQPNVLTSALVIGGTSQTLFSDRALPPLVEGVVNYQLRKSEHYSALCAPQEKVNDAKWSFFRETASAAVGSTTENTRHLLELCMRSSVSEAVNRLRLRDTDTFYWPDTANYIIQEVGNELQERVTAYFANNALLSLENISTTNVYDWGIENNVVEQHNEWSTDIQFGSTLLEAFLNDRYSSLGWSNTQLVKMHELLDKVFGTQRSFVTLNEIRDRLLETSGIRNASERRLEFLRAALTNDEPNLFDAQYVPRIAADAYAIDRLECLRLMLDRFVSNVLPQEPYHTQFNDTLYQLQLPQEVMRELQPIDALTPGYSTRQYGAWINHHIERRRLVQALIDRYILRAKTADLDESLEAQVKAFNALGYDERRLLVQMDKDANSIKRALLKAGVNAENSVDLASLGYKIRRGVLVTLQEDADIQGGVYTGASLVLLSNDIELGTGHGYKPVASGEIVRTTRSPIGCRYVYDAVTEAALSASGTPAIATKIERLDPVTSSTVVSAMVQQTVAEKTRVQSIVFADQAWIAIVGSGTTTRVLLPNTRVNVRHRFASFEKTSLREVHLVRRVYHRTSSMTVESPEVISPESVLTAYLRDANIPPIGQGTTVTAESLTRINLTFAQPLYFAYHEGIAVSLRTAERSLQCRVLTNDRLATDTLVELYVAPNMLAPDAVSFGLSALLDNDGDLVLRGAPIPMTLDDALTPLSLDAVVRAWVQWDSFAGRVASALDPLVDRTMVRNGDTIADFLRVLYDRVSIQLSSSANEETLRDLLSSWDGYAYVARNRLQDRPSVATAAWNYHVGDYLLSAVKLRAGKAVLSDLRSDWLRVRSELFEPEGKRSLHDRLIGHMPSAVVLEASKPSMDLYLRLPFYFDGQPSLALPLVALSQCDVHVDIDLAPLMGLLRTNHPDVMVSASGQTLRAELVLDMAYLSEEETKRFAQTRHDYMIERVLYNGEASVAGTGGEVPLNFTSAVKDLFFFLRTADHARFQPYNYTLTDYQDVSRLELDLRQAYQLLAPDHAQELDEVLSGLRGYQTPVADLTVDQRLLNLPSALRDLVRETFRRMQEDGPRLHHIVRTVALQCNGQDRFRLTGDMTGLVGHSAYHAHVPGLHVYSFAVQPLEIQPSGHYNLRNAEEPRILVTLTPEAEAQAFQAVVLARGYAVLTIASGMAAVSPP